MSVKTDICNRALVRLGNSKFISDVDNENSPNAKSFRLIFDDERDFILRDFAWNWAKQYSALALVDGSDSTVTNYDWKYAYGVPADCAMARRLSTRRAGRRNSTGYPAGLDADIAGCTPPAFELGQNDNGALLFTDEKDAILEYTKIITNLGRWDAIARSALAWRLALNLAGPLSRIKGIVDTCNGAYETEIDKARRAVLSERQPDPAERSEFERSRD